MVRIYFLGIYELPHLSRLCWAAFLVWRRTCRSCAVCMWGGFLPWLGRAGWLGGEGLAGCPQDAAVAALQAGGLSGPSCWLSASAVLALRARTGLPGSDRPPRAFQGAKPRMTTRGPRGTRPPQPHQDGDQQSRSSSADLASPRV